MKTFFKAQFSSFVATLADFGMTIFLVEVLSAPYLVALVCGAIAGAATNFLLNRYWSFHAANKPALQQGYRYSLVWTGSLVLNVSGTWMLTELAGMQYVVSKGVVALVVGLTFNYILQKKYVFAG